MMRFGTPAHISIRLKEPVANISTGLFDWNGWKGRQAARFWQARKTQIQHRVPPCRPAASRIRRRVSQGWFKILKRIRVFWRLTEDQDSVLIRKKKNIGRNWRGRSITSLLRCNLLEWNERTPTDANDTLAGWNSSTVCSLAAYHRSTCRDACFVPERIKTVTV